MQGEPCSHAEYAAGRKAPGRIWNRPYSVGAMLASTRKVHGAARVDGRTMFALQKQPRKAVAFRGCCTCDGKSGLRVRADDVTDDVDDVVSGQAVVTQDLIGGAGVTELIHDADAAHGDGQLLADDGADGLAQAADDAVLLDGDDAAALAGGRSG